jgi:hypothetical protein
MIAGLPPDDCRFLHLTDSDYYVRGGRGYAGLGEPLSAYSTIRYRF